MFSKEKAAPPTEAGDTAYLSICQPAVLVSGLSA
jgi:hypothetical protein